jgi:hypothetical protein
VLVIGSGAGGYRPRSPRGSDILVNKAGILRGGPLATTGAAEVGDLVLRTHLADGPLQPGADGPSPASRSRGDPMSLAPS